MPANKWQARKSSPSVPRNVVAALVGLACAFAAFYGAVVLQGTMVLRGTPGSQPLAAAPLARWVLARDIDATEEKGEFVRRAIRQSPLSPEAFTYLGIHADGDRADRLLEHAGRLSRHSTLTQQNLYNHFIDSNPALALQQAEALLRRQKSAEPLFEDFAQRVDGNRGFVEALGEAMRRSGGEAWPINFLSEHAAEIEDESIVALTPNLRTGGGDLDREATAQVIETLRYSRRNELGARLYTSFIAPEGYPLRLDWSENSVGSSGFGWRLAEGYRTAQDGQNGPVLRRSNAIGSDGTTRMLALPPGSYRLQPADGAADSGDWQWQLSCAAGGRKMSGRDWPASIAIGADCPVQQLELRAPFGSNATLGTLVFEPTGG